MLVFVDLSILANPIDVIILMWYNQFANYTADNNLACISMLSPTVFLGSSQILSIFK